jgi:subtilase family serine protease
MANLRTFPLCVLASAVLGASLLPAQTATASIANANRIVSPIDESHLVTLAGNTHPAANAKNDRGAVSPNLPMTDLILVLSRSPEQQAAFDEFVASQNDPSSPNYHQWLTPDQVGERFGPSTSDITAITSWLTGHGFTVTQVTRDHMSIRFNGTAKLVTNAFHTEIHNLEVNGVSHIANMSDPQIPAALSSVVVGVKALHNFFPRPAHHMGQQVMRDQQSGKWVRQSGATPLTALSSSHLGAQTFAKSAATAKPQFGISVGGTNPYLVEDVGPWDFATIYNVSPLWNNGIDGTGQTIAIAGTSAIDIGESTSVAAGSNGNNDVATFRTFFDLPTSNSYNTPIQISGNSQPLTVCTSTSSSALCSLSDLEENTLDVEWSGAVAKNAQIVLVASYPASATDDNLYDSESYIVNNVTAHIMSVSYGECELGEGTGGNVEYYNLWQTAAAEGIAVFVASGDGGSAACDQGGDTNGVPYPAEYGLSVNGLSSTPFNTSVGGTDFNWCPLTSTDACATEAATYWNTSNSTTTQSNAKGYVPEVPWNDTCTSPLALSYLESFFSGTVYIGSNNAQLAVTDAETGCNALFYNQNSLETYDNGADASLLYLVDTVGGGGGASSCVANSTNPTGTTFGVCTSGATSTGTSTNPDTGASQTSLTLVNNGWPKPSWQTGVSGIPSDGVRDQPDVSFFASDGFLSSSAYLVCVSAASSNATCTYSGTTEPTAQEVGGTSVGTPAMAGVMALINQKAGSAQGNPNSELYSLATKQSYSGCSAESVTTGGNCYFNDVDTGTNAMACDYDAYVTTPSPNCTIAHTGDYLGILPGNSASTGYDLATGLGSLNVANVVNGWTGGGGTTSTSTFTLTAGTPSSTSVTPGSSATIVVTIASVDGYTGTVSLTCQQTGTTATGGDGTTCTGGGSGKQVTLTSSTTSGNVTFTIGTTAATTAALDRTKMPGSGLFGAGGGAVLALLVFFGIPARRRSWRSMVGMVIAMIAIGFMAGCGSSSSNSSSGGKSDPGTTAGTYTYTVTSTPNPSVSPAVSTTFTVTVN